jgi:quercetin dioxygenase-like cupin family protein
MGPTPTQMRAKHAVTGRTLQFDLQDEVTQLRREDGWVANGQNAKTLVRHSEMRLVLLALRAGTRWKEHSTEHQIAVHVLEGRVRLHLDDDPTEIAAGTLLALDLAVSHEVEAVEDATVLLTIAAH